MPVTARARAAWVVDGVVIVEVADGPRQAGEEGLGAAAALHGDAVAAQGDLVQGAAAEGGAGLFQDLGLAGNVLPPEGVSLGAVPEEAVADQPVRLRPGPPAATDRRVGGGQSRVPPSRGKYGSIVKV